MSQKALHQNSSPALADTGRTQPRHASAGSERAGKGLLAQAAFRNRSPFSACRGQKEDLQRCPLSVGVYGRLFH
eukprot:1160523-Pelagomonas_calceolata.AAC.6